MTLEEQGAYRNLLDEATLRGGVLPDDERILGKASGDALRWRKVRSGVMTHFVQTPAGWRNETLDEVLQESARRAKKQRDYRHGRGNDAGNDAGNGTGNTSGHERGNASGNASRNNPGNKARPPDPDPVVRTRAAREESAPKARGSDPRGGGTQDQRRRVATAAGAARRAAAPVEDPLVKKYFG
jgi:uncharacterized protein YdaU (DUF1376 family)